MNRFVLVDNNSGYIFGDIDASTALEAACNLDADFPRLGRCYDEHGPGYRPAINETAFFVYSPAPDFPPVEDGTDVGTIDALEAGGKLVAVVTVTLAALSESRR